MGLVCDSIPKTLCDTRISDNTCFSGGITTFSISYVSRVSLCGAVRYVNIDRLFYLTTLEVRIGLAAVQVCDVLIIGGGVVGIASAYWLTKLQPDLRVILLEKHTVAHVASRWRLSILSFLNGAFIHHNSYHPRNFCLLRHSRPNRFSFLTFCAKGLFSLEGRRCVCSSISVTPCKHAR